MGRIGVSFLIPITERLVSADGFLQRRWELFLEELWRRVASLGVEKSFDLTNNVTTETDIDGLQFDKGRVSCAFIEFLVQRITTGTGATELVETGLLIASYNPTSLSWSLAEPVPNKPEDSGVTFSITTGGQVQYKTSNITGDAGISRIVYRVRTLSGKSALYSRLGER